MADAAVSMLMEPLISTIDQWLKEDQISLIKNVKDKLKEVSSKLRAVQDVLDDAEKQSVTKESVKDWLDELRYISYEMDDVLDEWNTSVSKRKLEEEAENPTEKISCSSFSTCCISPVKHVGMRRDIAWKINDINTRLDSVVKQIKDFDFALNQKNKSSVDDSLKTNRITNSIINVSETYVHNLYKLSEEASWSLFSEIAVVEEKKDPEMLTRIGREMVKKCKGIPLAVRILGNVFRFKKSVEEWEHLLHSKVWEIEKAEVELFPHLYLSYNELSPELKKCFSYCTLFPKNSKIDVRELIRYWMAQGYVTSTKGVYDLESKAKEYFEKLATSYFFQEFENDEFGNVLRCKMHNIVHDFALYLTRNENITIENKTQNSFSEKVRHVSWLYSGRDNDLPLTICGGGNLRSIIVHDRVLRNPVALIGRLECVRSLVLTKCHLEKLPKEMGSLVHLRLLDLSDNDDLDELPESICELYNLQTLDITRCRRKIKRLPERIGKLINLRHLLIALVNLENYPKSFESLTNLRKLTHFIVGRKFGKLEYLRNFKHLRGNLNITIENNDLDVREMVVDAEKAQLKNNKNIQELHILFKKKEAENEAVWEALLPATNLQKLTISNFFGTQYPSWLTNHSHFTNLRFLRIDDSTCSTLPPLWKLSCLETLMIWSNSSIKHIGREFLGIEDNVESGDDHRCLISGASSSSLVAFPKLVRLTFLFLFELEVWEDLREEHEEEPRVDTINKIQILPRLRELRIWCSEKLRQLPHRLLRKASSLECLEIRDCGIFLDNEKDDTEIQRQQQQLEQLLSHIPKLKINDLIYTPDNPAGMKAWSM